MNNFKKFLYELNTQHNNRIFLKKMKQHLITNDDIHLVHQMGRVASMTMVNTLKLAVPDKPVYHTHYLTERTLNDRINYLHSIGERITQRHLKVSKIMIPFLNQNLKNRNWNILTIIRDPIARNISAFFLDIERHIPNFHKQYALKSISTNQMIDTFIKDYEHNTPLDWFEHEIKSPFNLDVYKYFFPEDKGYSLIKNDNLQLLVIKLERFNDCCQSAFKDFTGISNIKPQDTHITKKDDSSGAYKDLLKDIKLPRHYVDRMYSSRFMTHFYSEEEIAKLRRKWLK